MSDGQWAIVELMGHKVVAGLASKDEMLGKPMLRVDVPATKDYRAFTQMFGESAIYCVTFVSEPVALAAAEQCRANPVAVYSPELVTRQQFDAETEKWQKEAQRWHRQFVALQHGLPAPAGTPDDDRYPADDLDAEGSDEQDQN